MKQREIPLFRNRDARKVLEEACRRQNVSMQLLRDLLEVQRSYAGSARQAGITSEFDQQFDAFLDDGESR